MTSYKMSDIPESDRPREKLLKRGARSLTNVELLAIFLRTGTKGKSALDLAKELLDQFGDLRSLLGAEPQQLFKVKGLGEAKYAQLKAAVELSRRYLQECLERGDPLTNPEDTRNFLMAELSGRASEVFAAIFLDNHHRVIKFEELFYGTIDGASVFPREVARRALICNAAAVIFAHNHPSGVADPSKADLEITQHLKQSLGMLDIRVLDHVVIGDGYCISLVDKGLM